MICNGVRCSDCAMSAVMKCNDEMRWCDAVMTCTDGMQCPLQWCKMQRCAMQLDSAAISSGNVQQACAVINTTHRMQCSDELQDGMWWGDAAMNRSDGLQCWDAVMRCSDEMQKWNMIRCSGPMQRCNTVATMTAMMNCNDEMLRCIAVMKCSG